MEFFHKRSMLFLRITFGIFFVWFGILLMFNVNPLIPSLKPGESLITHPQLLIFLLSVIEILIGVAYLSNRFVKLATLVMIAHELIGAVYLLVTQGFAPRFPVLSIFGILAIKDLILISSGLVILAEHNQSKLSEKKEAMQK